MLKSEVNPKIVNERLGHSTVGLTFDVYSHVAPSHKERLSKSSMKLWQLRMRLRFPSGRMRQPTVRSHDQRECRSRVTFNALVGMG